MKKGFLMLDSSSVQKRTKVLYSSFLMSVKGIPAQTPFHFSVTDEAHILEKRRQANVQIIID